MAVSEKQIKVNLSYYYKSNFDRTWLKQAEKVFFSDFDDWIFFTSGYLEKLD